jgi:hypothetical protein
MFVDRYSDDQSAFIAPEEVKKQGEEYQENFIHVHLPFTTEDYHPEIYDTYLDMMLHKYQRLQHPYEENHPQYIHCPLCPKFNELVKREYTSIKKELTDYDIIVQFPNSTLLKINVKERKTNAKHIDMEFRVDMSFQNVSSINNPDAQTLKFKYFIKSWMNSLLLELQTVSQKSKEKEDNESWEKEMEQNIFSALYFLRSSLY